MMELERFRQLIEAYGAAPARWPAAEREAARALAAANAAAAGLLTEAAGLDYLLDQAAALAPPIIDAEALIARATAAAPATAAGAGPRYHSAPSARGGSANDRGLWLRAASLAAAALIGFIVGASQLADTTDASAADSSSIDFSGDSGW
jgi:hypothetical protein